MLADFSQVSEIHFSSFLFHSADQTLQFQLAFLQASWFFLWYFKYVVEELYRIFHVIF